MKKLKTLIEEEKDQKQKIIYERANTQKEYEDIINNMENQMKNIMEKNKKSKSQTLENLKNEISTYFSNMVVGLLEMGGIKHENIKDIVKEQSKQLVDIIKECTELKFK